MPKERIPEIERLRGIAFLAVVLRHSIAHYSVAPGMTTGDGLMMAVLLMATKFAVPVFIFITGMVLFYNDKGQRITEGSSRGVLATSTFRLLYGP